MKQPIELSGAALAYFREQQAEAARGQRTLVTLPGGLSALLTPEEMVVERQKYESGEKIYGPFAAMDTYRREKAIEIARGQPKLVTLPDGLLALL